MPTECQSVEYHVTTQATNLSLFVIRKSVDSVTAATANDALAATSAAAAVAAPAANGCQNFFFQDRK